MKNINVLVFTRSLPFHQSGGMEIISWRILVELVRTGMRVTVITTSVPGKNDPFKQSGVIVIPLTGPPGKYSRQWRKSCRAWCKINIANYDVAFSVSTAARNCIDLLVRSNIKTIAQLHGTSMMELKTKLRSPNWFVKLTSLRNAMMLINDLFNINRFDKLVCVGDNVLNSLTSGLYKYFITCSKINLIYNGVVGNGHLGVSNDASASEPVFLIVSRLHWSKGVVNILKSFIEFSKQSEQGKLLIAGEGPCQKQLESIITQACIEDRVSLLGNISHDEIDNYYRSATAVIISGDRIECGLSLVQLEAMYHKLPIVVNQQQSFLLRKERVPHAEFSDRSVNSFIEALKKVLLNREDYKTSLPEKFTFNYMIKLYVDLIEDSAVG